MQKAFQIVMCLFFAVCFLWVKPLMAFNTLSSESIPRAGSALAFYLNPNMPSGTQEEQIDVTNLAMAILNDEGNSNFLFTYLGLTTSTTFYNGNSSSDDGQQIIIADACGADWTGACVCNGSVLGYTWGTSSDPDVIICSEWPYYVSTATTIASQEWDLVSLLIHELGHTLGLDHSNYTDSVMFTSLPAGVIRRTLWNCTGCSPLDTFDGGDVQGIQFLYGADDADGDGISIRAGDCDDSNATIYPGATEVCNSVDDDCDGMWNETCVNPIMYTVIPLLKKR